MPDSSEHRRGVGLHRISAILRDSVPVGLTYRVGRHFPGCAALIMDLIHGIAHSTGGTCTMSLLLLGRPGVGKTTLLREITRLFADHFRKRVVVVDTSDEVRCCVV